MFKSFHRRLIWIVAVSYLLASTCLGVWHSHPDGLHVCQHATDDSFGCGHDCDEPSVNHTGDEHVPGSTPEGDCSVCRFLAQSALPAPAVTLPMLGEVVAEARVAPPVCPVVWVVTGGPARAPPSDA